MADFFGNGFWAVRYFPSGYWGMEGEAPAGAMYATIQGSSSLTASLTSTTAPVLPVDFITGGTGFFRSPLRAAFQYSVNTAIPADIAARITATSSLEAMPTAKANATASLQGRSKVAATATFRIGHKAHNEAFWLLAA